MSATGKTNTMWEQEGKGDSTLLKSPTQPPSSKVQVKLSPSIKQGKYISNFVCQILPEFSDRRYLKYFLFSRLIVWRRKQILEYTFILHLELLLHFDGTSRKCAPIHSK